VIGNSNTCKDTFNASLDDFDVEESQSLDLSNTVHGLNGQNDQNKYDIPFAKKKRGRKKQPANEYLKQARKKVDEIEAEY
jgi:hypothetical protein